jgi:hypothetical protein
MRIGVMNKTRLILVVAAMLLMAGFGSNDFYASHNDSPGVTKHDARMSVSQAIRKARKLERRKEWAKADGVYKSALAQHSRSKKLKRRYRSFQARRSAKTARYEVDSMVAKARWLKKRHRYLKATDSSYRGEHWGEAVSISKKLAKKGLKAMDRKQMNLAYRALSQSVKIDSNSTTRRAYGRYRSYKERRDFARLVKKGRKMADNTPQSTPRL